MRIAHRLPRNAGGNAQQRLQEKRKKERDHSGGDAEAEDLGIEIPGRAKRGERREAPPMEEELISLLQDVESLKRSQSDAKSLGSINEVSPHLFFGFFVKISSLIHRSISSVSMKHLSQ